MKSYPQPEQVFDDLGDKVLEGFSAAVGATAEDLSEYRILRPDWVSQASERGLANWLHDRLWHHMNRELMDLPHVTFRGTEPNRELFVGHHYRLRAKRHSEDGGITTYPTLTALEFMTQDVADQLLTVSEIRLCVGYEWDSTSRSVVRGVISLRDDQGRKIIWMQGLDEAVLAVRAAPTTVIPAVDEPTAPEIEVKSDAEAEDEAEDSGSA